MSDPSQEGTSRGRPAACELRGLVLAAGSGGRLGLGPKALLRIAPGGRTLLGHTVAVLAEACRDVVVVTGAGAADVRTFLDRVHPSGVTAVENPLWRSGMASSLRTGVRALAAGTGGDRAVLVAVVDQPGLSGEIVDRIVAARAPGRVVAADYGGGPRHPVVFPGGLLEEAASLARGDAGARSWLRSHPGLVDLVGCSDLDDGSDLDLPEDLDRWKARVRDHRCP